MTVYLYNMTSENNKINKVLSSSESYTGNVKEPFDIIDPEIVLEIATNNITNAKILGKNYLQIGNPINRYYFITDVIIEGNKLVRIKCHEDVLMTYASAITSTLCLIERTETSVSPHITDSQRPFYNYPMILTKEFSSGFDGLEYYLTTAG